MLKQCGFSEQTGRAYVGDLHNFFQFIAMHRGTAINLGKDQLDFQLFSLSNLRAYLAYGLQNNNSYATLARRTASIKSFLKWANAQNYVNENTSLRLQTPKVRSALPKVIHVSDTEKFLDYLAFKAVESPLYARDWLAFELLYGSALRVGEVCALDISSVRDDKLRVLGKGNKERLVPLGYKAQLALTYWLENPQGRQALVHNNYSTAALLLGKQGKRVNARVLRQALHNWVAKLGIADIAPHSLRHSAATDLLNAGADLRSVQEIIGHSSLQTTQRYTHLSTQKLLDVFKQAHPRA